MGGGTVAALIMGVLAVVGLVVAIVEWRFNNRSTNAHNQPHPPVTAQFNNRAFAPTTSKGGAAAANKPLQQHAASTLYAIPMEAAGNGSGIASAAPSSASAPAIASGQVMYVAALNSSDPKYASADISTLYTVVSNPSGRTAEQNNQHGVDADDGRYSGYEPPPGNGSSVEYATPAEDTEGGQELQVHYDLARQDTIVNHYDLPAPGRRRTKRRANQLQSDA